MDGTAVNFLLADLPTWGVSLGPKLHHGGRFFGPGPFLILKSSNQDLPNEGYHFILTPLEIVHWVAQKEPFLTYHMNLQI